MGIHQSDFIFIAKENMTSIYELSVHTDLAELAYCHFMNHKDEILYLSGEDGRIAGILSIGDLERFYKGDKGIVEINREYIRIDAVDFDIAAEFFEDAKKTVNELPVVADGNKLLGSIRRKKEDCIRDKQRNSLRNAKRKWCRTLWYRNEVRRFVSKTKAKVFLYTYSEKESMRCFSSEEIRRIRTRCGDRNPFEWLLDKERKRFWQFEYEEEFVHTMKAEIEACRVDMRNGVTVFPDKAGKCYNFQNGCRVTPGASDTADRRIFMFGPCIVFGYYVRDEQTIAAYLQDYLNKEGYTTWKVLNKGFCSTSYCYNPMFVEELSKDDIVLIWCMDGWMPKVAPDKTVLCGDLSEVFFAIPTLQSNIVDHVTHCNYVVNQKLAERIFSDLCMTGVLEEPQSSNALLEKQQNYYISWDIHDYFIDYFEQYGLHKGDESSKAGAIVMNCNPFTKGHRYLIEQALGMTDRLYVFVVEEDKSYFKFRDRLKMVEMGVSDLSNVCVVPSGKYILSKDTFAQYFEKEQVQVVENMDYDIYIFGEVVAAKLGIQYRFVGEEPFDKVTKEYNETMKRILPEFGVEVVEIPRTTFDKKQEQVISATLVRRALQEKDLNTIEQLCPESTVRYLKEKFLA